MLTVPALQPLPTLHHLGQLLTNALRNIHALSLVNKGTDHSKFVCECGVGGERLSKTPPISWTLPTKFYWFPLGSRGGAVVRALTSHQCGQGSIPGLGVICGLSLLLVLIFALRGFSAGTPVFTSPQKQTLLNSNSIWKVSPKFSALR